MDCRAITYSPIRPIGRGNKGIYGMRELTPVTPGGAPGASMRVEDAQIRG